MNEYYKISKEDTLKQLGVKEAKGLSSGEARNRLEQFGPNVLEAAKRINPIKLFLSQFNDILVIILIVAACISLGLSYVGVEEFTKADPQQQQAYVDLKCPEAVLAVSGGVDIECSKALNSTGDGVQYEVVCRDDEHCKTVVVGEEHSGEAEGITESLLIFAIVIAIAIIGFLNEYKAEKTVEALRKLVGQKAHVRRDGESKEVDAVELVPGDIVLLEEGAKIPADLRLLDIKSLSVNEASLTGESVPVSKHLDPIGKTVTVGDRKNMVFSGTIVTTGTAVGVVVKTAHDTELGKIAQMVNEVEAELTPMQRKLDDLGRKLGAIILVISLIVFVAIFVADKDIAEDGVIQRLILAFTAAVALAVAAIPEGLAFVVRISLALGARRMAAKDALVRRLSAVEALGSTDVICSDKTGTLTRGEMTVRKLWFDGGVYEVSGSGYDLEGEFTRAGDKVASKELMPLLRVGVLCNNARIKEGAVLGDPTEGCLIVSAAKAGLAHDAEIRRAKRVDELPFTSDRKRMSTVHKTSKGYVVAAKGAVDVLLNQCDKVMYKGKVQRLTPKVKKEILEHNHLMAQDALRVLGFAFKETTSLPKGEKQIESKLTFLGLQGMMDSPRQEVKEVMHRVHSEAGMQVIMITGDHIDTAKAVAAEIGIEGEAISGTELDELSQAEFEKKVEKISVYARVNPEHKIRIVQALKKHGHQVAMTGDGVNDAPAIKAADIGIAMGITGTDAAKEAADLILLDDQFLTIIDAIEEGRGIFDNVRKFVNYLLSANIAEVITIFGGVMLMGKLVLSAAQLLFINIVTDGLPAVALGSDPAEKGIMRFKPRRFQGAIINTRIWLEMAIFGLLMSLILLVHYWYIDSVVGDATRAVSVAFTGMVVYEMMRLIGIRTDYAIKWFSNPWLSVAIAGSMALLLSVLYIPFVADVFGVQPILSIDWLIILGGSVVLLIVMKVIDIILDHAFQESIGGTWRPKHERI